MMFVKKINIKIFSQMQDFALDLFIFIAEPGSHILLLFCRSGIPDQDLLFFSWILDPERESSYFIAVLGYRILLFYCESFEDPNLDPVPGRDHPFFLLKSIHYFFGTIIINCKTLTGWEMSSSPYCMVLLCAVILYVSP
jgi:hypothetical protein